VGFWWENARRQALSTSLETIFARSLLDRFPLLPVEEEGRLHDLPLRENFVERVFCYRRWRDLKTGASRGAGWCPSIGRRQGAHPARAGNRLRRSLHDGPQGQGDGQEARQFARVGVPYVQGQVYL